MFYKQPELLGEKGKTKDEDISILKSYILAVGGGRSGWFEPCPTVLCDHGRHAALSEPQCPQMGKRQQGPGQRGGWEARAAQVKVQTGEVDPLTRSTWCRDLQGSGSFLILSPSGMCCWSKEGKIATTGASAGPLLAGSQDHVHTVSPGMLLLLPPSCGEWLPAGSQA